MHEPTAARRCFIYGVIAVVLLGHLATVVADPPGEAWPFSQYSMYSKKGALFPRLGGRRLYALEESSRREIPIVDGSFLDPLDAEYLSVGFERIARSGDRNRLREALDDCARRYEARRRRGQHTGPPLAGLRLYDVWWTPDPELRNLLHPDGRRMVAEVP